MKFKFIDIDVWDILLLRGDITFTQWLFYPILILIGILAIWGIIDFIHCVKESYKYNKDEFGE